MKDVSEIYPSVAERVIVYENTTRPLTWHGMALELSHKSGWLASVKAKNLDWGEYTPYPDPCKMDGQYGLIMIGCCRALVHLERGRDEKGYFIAFTLNPWRAGEVLAKE